MLVLAVAEAVVGDEGVAAVERGERDHVVGVGVHVFVAGVIADRDDEFVQAQPVWERAALGDRRAVDGRGAALDIGVAVGVMAVVCEVGLRQLARGVEAVGGRLGRVGVRQSRVEAVRDRRAYR